MKTKIALLLLMTPLTALAESIDRTLDVQADTNIYIDVKEGRVRVETWSKRQVRVVGEIDGNIDDFTFSSSDNSVVIDTGVGQKGWGNWGGNRADITVYTPENSSYRLKGVSASIELNDIKGSVTANSVSGDITLNGGSGRLKLESVSGSIEVDDATGALHVSSVSGDIEVQAKANRFEARTVSGDIEAEIGLSESIGLESVSGDVEANLSLAKEARLDASTVSGDIDLDFANKDLDAEFDIATGPGGSIRNKLSDDRPKTSNWSSDELEFTLGSGSADVDLETMSGTITVDN